ncbi:uncharacterized protein EI90DRAFT_1792168 [Cantharellus anzutake]|uniref:uncharacterized protein n=1 Tax=Cantharellus anzutake TaxID=1750568 RepID=UPI0019057E6E|nr:uncharacterized protein EI90DRAFT_1792168 [Cantharellus anzutake]KAF8327428.1 hypothetical protein EI90DRAFT_1792168 [Cantharellus anzutake]
MLVRLFHVHPSASQCVVRFPDTPGGITAGLPFRISWTNCTTPVQVQVLDKPGGYVLQNYIRYESPSYINITDGNVGRTIYLSLRDRTGSFHSSLPYVVKPNSAFVSSSSMSASHTIRLAQCCICSVCQPCQRFLCRGALGTIDDLNSVSELCPVRALDTVCTLRAVRAVRAVRTVHE